MENLSLLELEILNRLSSKYPLVKLHIPYLKVKSRQKTGVGMYVNFTYTDEIVERLKISDSSISSNDIIMIEGLKSGLNYEVDVTDGKLNFIEIVSNGEPWDGTLKDFFFIQI